MQKKSKLTFNVNQEKIPKRWRNDPAFYYWKQQTTLCENEIQSEKIKYEIALDKWLLLLKTHATENERIQEVLQSLKNAQNEDLKELAKKHAVDMLDMTERIKAIKEKHIKEIEPVKKQLDESDQSCAIVKENHKLAQNRCKDPIIKNMAKTFPRPILDLIVDYNAYGMCKICCGYFPKKTKCLKTKGHSYICKLPPLFSFYNGGSNISWQDSEDQTMFEEFFSAVKSNTKAISQDTENNKEYQTAHANMAANIIVGSNFNSLGIYVRSLKKVTILYRISNVFAHLNKKKIKNS